jgi:NitT/TauT family transport system permease protein
VSRLPVNSIGSRITVMPTIIHRSSGLSAVVRTGWITALGGAWNASIVAEYLRHQGQTLQTLGLGAAISRATERGEFHLLAAGIGLMAVTVVGFNRMVWRRLERLARSKYSMES